MKINLEKLQEVEAKYKNSTVAYNALNTMVNAVLNQPELNGLNFGPSIAMAHTTLTELGIIDQEGAIKPEKKSKQLNS